MDPPLQASATHLLTGSQNESSRCRRSSPASMNGFQFAAWCATQPATIQWLNPDAFASPVDPTTGADAWIPGATGVLKRGYALLQIFKNSIQGTPISM